MTDKPAALQADFTSYKPVPSRKVLQLVFEVPLETQEQTFRTLGYPTPGESTWVAVARLNLKRTQAEGATAPNPKKPLTRSQLAAVKLQNKDFCAWLVDTYWTGKEEIGDYDGVLKRVLLIGSKSELDTNPEKADAFDRLMTDFDTRSYR